MNNKVSTKPCCACGQEILAVAQRCRYCKAWQSESPPQSAEPQSREPQTIEAQPVVKSSKPSPLRYILVVVVVVVAMIVFALVSKPSQSRMEQAVANDLFEHYLKKVKQAAGFIFGDEAQDFVGLLGDFSKDELLKGFRDKHTFYVEGSPFHSVLYMGGPSASGWQKVAVGFCGMVFTYVEDLNFEPSASKSQDDSEEYGADSVRYFTPEDESYHNNAYDSIVYQPGQYQEEVYEEDDQEEDETYEVDSLS